MIEITMLNREKIDEYIVNVFKAGMVIRVFCLFAKVLLDRYNLADSFIFHVITFISITMLAITTGIIIYKAVTIFNKNHQELLIKHRHMTLIIEFIVMRIAFFLLFINQTVASKFVLYLNNLSETQQQGSYIFLMMMLAILIGRYLKRIINLDAITLSDNSVYKRLIVQAKSFLLKIFIGIVTVSLMMYAPFTFLQPRTMYVFIQSTLQKIMIDILNYMNSSFFLYVQTLFFFCFIVWILIDLYSVHTMYKHSKDL